MIFKFKFMYRMVIVKRFDTLKYGAKAIKNMSSQGELYISGTSSLKVANLTNLSKYTHIK